MNENKTNSESYTTVDVAPGLSEAIAIVQEKGGAGVIFNEAETLATGEYQVTEEDRTAILESLNEGNARNYSFDMPIGLPRNPNQDFSHPAFAEIGRGGEGTVQAILIESGEGSYNVLNPAKGRKAASAIPVKAGDIIIVDTSVNEKGELNHPIYTAFSGEAPIVISVARSQEENYRNTSDIDSMIIMGADRRRGVRSDWEAESKHLEKEFNRSLEYQQQPAGRGNALKGLASAARNLITRK